MDIEKDLVVKSEHKFPDGTIMSISARVNISLVKEEKEAVDWVLERMEQRLEQRVEETIKKFTPKWTMPDLRIQKP